MSAPASADVVTTGSLPGQREIIDAIAASQTFEHAPASRALLIYLFQHHGAAINEYMIGTEALGRRQDFDPRTDAAVRVQLSRLRSKLVEYAAHEGKNAHVEVVLPRGGYVLEFLDRSPQGLQNNSLLTPEHQGFPLSNSDQVKESGHGPLVWTRAHFIGILGLLLLTSVTTFLLTRKTLGRKAQKSPNLSSSSFPDASFWPSIAGDHLPVRILVPNPTFFKWEDSKSKESIHIRSVNINSFEDIGQSPFLSKLSRELGPPVLSQEYMSVYDARSTLLLLSFLNDHGVSAQFSFAAEYSTDQMDKENVILLGTGTTLHRFDRILKATSLRFDPLTTAITRVDEEGHVVQHFEAIKESGDVTYLPQMLACVPTSIAGKKALVIAGFRNQALLHYITSDAGQSEIARRQRVGNSPFFEAVVLSEVNGNTPLHSSIVYFRPLPPKYVAGDNRSSQ